MTAQPLFFLQGAVHERARLYRKRATMAALELSLMMQELQILANGDQRCVEALRQITHQYTPVCVKQFHDGAPPFFTQHKNSPRYSSCSSFHAAGKSIAIQNFQNLASNQFERL